MKKGTNYNVIRPLRYIIQFYITLIFCRELLWYSFLELVTSVLPSINIPFIKTWLQNKYNFYIAKKDEKEKSTIRHMSGERNENFNKISNEVLKECKMCKQSPIILPSTGGCGHYYCYYCISGNLEASSH